MIDVNVTRTADGATALHLAAHTGKDKMVKLLLDCDADPSLVAQGRRLVSSDGDTDAVYTALQLAELKARKLSIGSGGHGKCATLLSKTGAGGTLIRGRSRRRSASKWSMRVVGSPDRLAGSPDPGTIPSAALNEAAPDRDALSLASVAPVADAHDTDAESTATMIDPRTDSPTTLPESPPPPPLSPEASVQQLVAQANTAVQDLLETTKQDKKAAQEALKLAKKREKDAKREAKLLRKGSKHKNLAAASPPPAVAKDGGDGLSLRASLNYNSPEAAAAAAATAAAAAAAVATGEVPTATPDIPDNVAADGPAPRYHPGSPTPPSADDRPLASEPATPVAARGGDDGGDGTCDGTVFGADSNKTPTPRSSRGRSFSPDDVLPFGQDRPAQFKERVFSVGDPSGLQPAAATAAEPPRPRSFSVPVRPAKARTRTGSSSAEQRSTGGDARQAAGLADSGKRRRRDRVHSASSRKSTEGLVRAHSSHGESSAGSGECQPASTGPLSTSRPASSRSRVSVDAVGGGGGRDRSASPATAAGGTPLVRRGSRTHLSSSSTKKDRPASGRSTASAFSAASASSASSASSRASSVDSSDVSGTMAADHSIDNVVPFDKERASSDQSPRPRRRPASSRAEGERPERRRLRASSASSAPGVISPEKHGAVAPPKEHRRRSVSARSTASSTASSMPDPDRPKSGRSHGSGGSGVDGSNKEYYIPDACTVCKKVCDIQLCVQCLSVGYCSRECQKGDWSAHKIECRALGAV